MSVAVNDGRMHVQRKFAFPSLPLLPLRMLRPASLQAVLLQFDFIVALEAGPAPEDAAGTDTGVRRYYGPLARNPAPLATHPCHVFNHQRGALLGDAKRCPLMRAGYVTFSAVSICAVPVGRVFAVAPALLGEIGIVGQSLDGLRLALRPLFFPCSYRTYTASLQQHASWVSPLCVLMTCMRCPCVPVQRCHGAHALSLGCRTGLERDIVRQARSHARRYGAKRHFFRKSKQGGD